MGATVAAMIAGLVSVSADGGWSTVASGRLATVQMERVLYEATGSTDFWVHFRVHNRSAAPLGVQLEPGWQVLFPNQFGASQVDHREVIDERRLVVPPLDAAARRGLEEAWRGQRLISVAPGGDRDYFRPFNGAGRAQIDALEGPFVIISVDGELRLTNGEEVEQLRPAEGSGREVAFPVPVRWREVPASAVRVPVR
jgi:hypothetical protein